MAYAAVLGMVEDLDLKGQQYSLLGSIFYFGYLLMEGPTAWILTRAPTGKYISILMLLWGFSLCMMASCTSFAGAAVIRFLLGMLEAGLMPACIVLTATWYRREEQPLRTALWYCPFSAVSQAIIINEKNHSPTLACRSSEESCRTRLGGSSLTCLCGRCAKPYSSRESY